MASPTYELARKRVQSKWGTRARAHLGDTLYQALIGERIFFVCVLQDPSVSGESIKRILSECHTDLVNEMNEEQ